MLGKQLKRRCERATNLKTPRGTFCVPHRAQSHLTPNIPSQQKIRPSSHHPPRFFCNTFALPFKNPHLHNIHTPSHTTHRFFKPLIQNRRCSFQTSLAANLLPQDNARSSCKSSHTTRNSSSLQNQTQFGAPVHQSHKGHMSKSHPNLYSPPQTLYRNFHLPGKMSFCDSTNSKTSPISTTQPSPVNSLHLYQPTHSPPMPFAKTFQRKMAFASFFADLPKGRSSLSAQPHRLFSNLHEREKVKEEAATLLLERLFEKSKNDSFCGTVSSTSLVETSPPAQEFFRLIEPEIEAMKENIISLIQAVHPVLTLVARYYFDLAGKRVRPTMMLLLAKALQSHLLLSSQDLSVSANQIQLAEIVEMIHTASLVHDDVIDTAVTRRGVTSINVEMGNKVSILAGDYLLSRASISLSQLENFEVTKLISTLIGDLVEGEFMQMDPENQEISYYIQKSYYKTASLMANACRSVAVLANAPVEQVELAFDYGKNVGLAFQLIDDVLDFTGSSSVLGKEASVDLKLGLATAPVLYARDEFPELVPLIARKFRNEGDVELARDLVAKSQGLQKTRLLAKSYVEKAIQSANTLHPSPARQGLVELANLVVYRHN